MSVNSHHSTSKARLFAERSTGAAPTDGQSGRTLTDPDGAAATPYE
jgi:hypothetical protein